MGCSEIVDGRVKSQQGWKKCLHLMVHLSELLCIDLELLPGRQQRGAIDLLGGLDQRGVDLLLRHLHDTLQEQL